MKTTVVDESLSSTNNYSSVPEKINLLQLIQQNEKPTQIYLFLFVENICH